jgi:hypothetical protein
MLSTFRIPEIKVRVICSHFKEPKAGPLLAVLPFLRLAASAAAAGVSASAAHLGLAPAFPHALQAEPKQAQGRGKKRKALASPLASGAAAAAAASARPPLAASASTVPFALAAPKPAPTYAEMRPAKRRKCLSELISRTAQQLESKYLLSVDDQRSLVERQRGEMRQVVEDDPVQGIHTLGMWRWLEKSGHFARVTDSDIRWRLDSTSSRPSPPPPPGGGSAAAALQGRRGLGVAGPAREEKSSDEIANRLQSLLVSEESDDERSDGDDHVEEDVDDLYEDSKLGNPEHGSTSSFFRELDALGLRADAMPLPADDHVARLFDERADVVTRTSQVEPGDPGDELGDVIHAMIDDLHQLNGVNNQRTTFLESVAALYQLGDVSGRKAEDASLVARYQQLLRKSKEAKGKNGKLKTAKKDEYSLPW